MRLPQRYVVVERPLVGEQRTDGVYDTSAGEVAPPASTSGNAYTGASDTMGRRSVLTAPNAVSVVAPVSSADQVRSSCSFTSFI